MECLPSGGWFSLGLRPRENHPPSGKHSVMLPPLAWHICITYNLNALDLHNSELEREREREREEREREREERERERERESERVRERE